MTEKSMDYTTLYAKVRKNIVYNHITPSSTSLIKGWMPIKDKYKQISQYANLVWLLIMKNPSIEKRCFEEVTFYYFELEDNIFYKTMRSWNLLFDIDFNLVPSVVSGKKNCLHKLTTRRVCHFCHFLNRHRIIN